LEPTERMAAYIAGELDADERDALEADLARDPGLRGQLAAMRRADEALTRLRSPSPSEGFEDRLAAVVGTELEHRLGCAEEHDQPAVADELAAHRQRRARVWAPRLAGAAAAVLVLTAVVVAVRPPGDDDALDLAEAPEATEAPDAPEADADDGAAMAPTEERTEAGSEAAPEQDAAPEAMMDVAETGPVVVVGDRELDEDTLGRVAAEPVLAELAARGLGTDEGAEEAQRWRRALQVSAAPFDTADEPGEDEAAVPSVRTVGPVSERDLEEVGRCLEALDPVLGTVIPAYVEVAELQGRRAIAYGVVAEDPATGGFTGVEVWLVDPEGCSVVDGPR